MSGPVLSRITLSNPTAGDWDNFIIENAELSGAKAAAEWAIKKAKAPRHIQAMMKHGPPFPQMAAVNSCSGRTLVLCGAGPSLTAHWREYIGPEGVARMPKTDVWACNSALTWLLEQGAYVTHGFGIDQTDGLLTEWQTAPPVKYVVASSVNPKTIRHLLDHKRQLMWFHNFVGSQRERELYLTIWPTSVMVGDGLNSVNRAMCLAQFLNYKRVIVIGADCAMHGDTMHANGDGPTAHGATAVIMDSVIPIGGTMWATKPDMIFSAVAIARLADGSRRFELVGDTLPSAIIREGVARGIGGKAFAEWMADELADLEDMKGIPNPSSGRVAKPKGRNMVSKLFAVRQTSLAQHEAMRAEQEQVKRFLAQQDAAAASQS